MSSRLPLRDIFNEDRRDIPSLQRQSTRMVNLSVRCSRPDRQHEESFSPIGVTPLSESVRSKTGLQQDGDLEGAGTVFQPKLKLFNDDDDDEVAGLGSPNLTSTQTGEEPSLTVPYTPSLRQDRPSSTSSNKHDDISIPSTPLGLKTLELQSPILTPNSSREGSMEWDLSFATPKQLRRTFGQRRSTGGIYSDEDSMLSSPPFKMLKKMDSSMFSEPSSPDPGQSPLISNEMKQLCLFDSPRTPKTLVRRASFQLSPNCKAIKNIRSKLEDKAFQKPPLPPSSSRQQRRTSISASCGSNKHLMSRQFSKGANRNPFTPEELHSLGRVHSEQKSAPSCGRSGKKLDMKESNISRYNAEFREICKIGCGHFGTVYKCINRLDGYTYALKKSKKPVAGSSSEAAALKEVYAHAVLGAHEHIVRYYSAWSEDNHMIIQNEYCNGGNLTGAITENRRRGVTYSEQQLKELLRQLAEGLQYMHSKQLVHLDVKPDNIFLNFHDDIPMDQSDSGIYCTPGPSSGDSSLSSITTTYKIGDMGHVTSICNPSVEDGDCRFLPRELLNDDYSQLTKADMFSLGLSVYAAGSSEDLPKNGDQWHAIRDGELPPLSHCSTAFNIILKLITSPDPNERPSAKDLLTHPLLSPSTCSCDTVGKIAELERELDKKDQQLRLLQHELKVAKRKGDSSINFGAKKFNRSSSVNIF